MSQEKERLRLRESATLNKRWEEERKNRKGRGKNELNGRMERVGKEKEQRW